MNTSNSKTNPKDLKSLIKPKSFSDTLMSYGSIVPAFMDIAQGIK